MYFFVKVSYWKEEHSSFPQKHLHLHVSFGIAQHLPPPSLMFNIELDSCLDPNRPAEFSDSIELPLSIKLMASWEGFFIFFGIVSDARLRSIPDLLNLAPRCFCFSVAIDKRCCIIIFYSAVRTK